MKINKNSKKKFKNKIDLIRLMLLIQLFLGIYQLPSYAQVKSLDYYLKQGLTNSPVLKDLKNQINSNLVDSLLIRANRNPMVGFNTSLYYAPVINGYGYDEAITNLNTISSVISVSHKIFNGYAVESEYSKIGIQKQSLKLTERISQNDLKKIITSQYLTTCSIAGEIKYNSALLTSLKAEEEILHQLVEKGIYKQVDYLSFQVEVQNEDLLMKDLQIQYQKEYSVLNVICGLQDTSYGELPLPDIKKLPTLVSHDSPFFLQFAVDSLRIQNEKSFIDANYKPSVTWYLDAGVVNIIPNDIKKNLGFSMGFNVSLPLYDGGQRSLNYQKLDITEETRKGYFNYFKTQFSQQLQQLNSELNKTEESLQLARQQQYLIESILQQNKILLNKGDISIVDFVIALRNYITVKHNINQYEIKVLQIINEMNYWNE